jgi:hypothetical protein
MAISRVAGQMLQTVLERDGVDLSFANANIGINTASPNSEFEVVGDITVGNIVISNVGNISAGNVNINNLANPTANADAATKFYVDSMTGNVTGIGNLTVNDTTIQTVAANANINIQTNGTGIFVIEGTNGFVMPVGNTDQRPSPAATGTLRFNSDYSRIEYYDGAEWDVVAGGVSNQTFNGDGSTLNFNLARNTTASAVLVMLNGIVQVPAVSYTITGAGANVLTFVQAPSVSDLIDVRYL